MTADHDLLAHFPPGAEPRPAQARLLEALGAAIGETEGAEGPRVFMLEAPPGVGKSHVALTLARWSGDAYLLTSQKLLQDQYEREFGDAIQLVKGRENYLCERAQPARVTTSHGLCRRPRGPFCQCPYARAKLAALNGPIFCTNTAYFLTLRQWQREQLRPRRVLVVDEAHNLEAQLVRVFTVAFAPDQMKEWFGGPLPRLGDADEYRILFEDQVGRLDGELTLIDDRLASLRPPGLVDDDLLSYPLTAQEQALLGQRDLLESALARLHFFLDAEDTEWVVRYPDADRRHARAGAAHGQRDGARAPVGCGGARRAVLGVPGAPRGDRRLLRPRARRRARVRERVPVRPSSSASSSTGRWARSRRPRCPSSSPLCSARWRRSWPLTRRRRVSFTPPPTRRPDGSSPTSRRAPPNSIAA